MISADALLSADSLFTADGYQPPALAPDPHVRIGIEARAGRLPHILAPKDPAASLVLDFDFAGELQAVDSAALSVTLVNGPDPAPWTIMDGAKTLSGAIVSQRISGGLDKCNYKINAVARQGSEIRALAAVVPVRAA